VHGASTGQGEGTKVEANNTSRGEASPSQKTLRDFNISSLNCYIEPNVLQQLKNGHHYSKAGVPTKAAMK